MDDFSLGVDLEVGVQLGPPGLLHTVGRPQHLLHLRGAVGWTFKCHRVVQSAPLRIGDLNMYNVQQSLSRYNKTHLAVRAELPHLDVVNEGDVVGGVPVQAVAVHGEGDGVQQCVDGRHHFLSILASRAVLDGQAPADEIILNIHNHEGRLRLHYLQFKLDHCLDVSHQMNLGDPAVPAVDELLHTHTAVAGGVEDHEEVGDLLAVQGVGLAFLILEQSRAQSCELVDVDGFVSSNMFYIKKTKKSFNWVTGLLW